MLPSVVLEVQSLLRQLQAYQLYLQRYEKPYACTDCFLFLRLRCCVRLFVGVIVARVWVSLVLL